MLFIFILSLNSVNIFEPKQAAYKINFYFWLQYNSKKLNEKNFLFSLFGQFVILLLQ